MLADGFGAALLLNIPVGLHPPGLFLFCIFSAVFFFFLTSSSCVKPVSVSPTKKDNPIFSLTAPTPLAHPSSGAERRFEYSKLSSLGFCSPNSLPPKWQRHQGPQISAMKYPTLTTEKEEKEHCGMK